MSVSGGGGGGEPAVCTDVSTICLNQFHEVTWPAAIVDVDIHDRMSHQVELLSVTLTNLCNLTHNSSVSCWTNTPTEWHITIPCRLLPENSSWFLFAVSKWLTLVIVYRRLYCPSQIIDKLIYTDLSAHNYFFSKFTKYTFWHIQL